MEEEQEIMISPPRIVLKHHVEVEEQPYDEVPATAKTFPTQGAPHEASKGIKQTQSQQGKRIPHGHHPWDDWSTSLCCSTYEKEATL